MKENCVISVALPTPLRKLFDYLPPIDPINLDTLTPGLRVLVPFGRSQRMGVIVEIKNHSLYERSKLKHIQEILDTKPLLPASIQNLIRWASDYYQAALGEVFSVALPVWLRKGKAIPVASEKGSDEKEKKKATPEMPILLNKEQETAVQAICQSLGKFQTFLLEGITGSGKTEVYMQVIAKVLSEKKQALVLVPEIGLTPQMLERFSQRFQAPIAVLHSSISEKKRFLAWQSAQTGEAAIVIGTRSAVFTPLLSPGVFIIDEEHDSSFKQQDSFRYHARDLMILRGSMENCPVVLGTATPSLETLQNVHTQRYRQLRLSARAGNAKLPEVQMIDIRHKNLDEGLSSDLLQEMKKHLAEKGQVLLFLNRRGFAPVLMCYDCGYVANCKHCDARLTLHYHQKKLCCHHCEFTQAVFEKCPACESLNLNALGVGTERLEEALMRHFPDKNIVRIDKDTTRKKGALQNAVARVKTGEADILLGTQMIAKGHHFPNVTLVVILDIDHALFSSDFRSLEHLGQLLTQVSGRAGREERMGKCVLQSCHPQHPLLSNLLTKGYASFAEQLLLERRNAGLPPYSYQALMRCEAKTLAQAMQFLNFFKQRWVKKNAANEANKINAPSSMHGLTLLGPVSSPMERRAGRFHAQLLIQAPQRKVLQALLKWWIQEAESAPLGKAVRWSLDVDPIDMY